jgi:hypothetical protein
LRGWLWIQGFQEVVNLVLVRGLFFADWSSVALLRRREQVVETVPVRRRRRFSAGKTDDPDDQESTGQSSRVALDGKPPFADGLLDIAG